MTLLWRKVHQRSLVFMQVLFSELEFGVLVLRRLENRRITLGEKREPTTNSHVAQLCQRILWTTSEVTTRMHFASRDSGAPFAYHGTRDGEKPANSVYF